VNILQGPPFFPYTIQQKKTGKGRSVALPIGVVCIFPNYRIIFVRCIISRVRLGFKFSILLSQRLSKAPEIAKVIFNRSSASSAALLKLCDLNLYLSLSLSKAAQDAKLSILESNPGLDTYGTGPNISQP
jgi:hypothetical protein